MLRFIFSVIFLLCLTCAQAEENRPNLVITDILNNNEIRLAIYGHKLVVGEKLSIISKSNNQVLGHVEVEEVGTEPVETLPSGENSPEAWARARIIVHSKNAIPIVGDLLDKINLSDESEHYPGRGDLIVFSGEDWSQGKEKISARYRSIVDQGLLIGETASTLQKNEHYFNIATKYAYGLTNKLSLSTVAALDIASIYNINLKYNALRNEDFLITPTLGYSHWNNEDLHKSNLVFGMYVDIMTNSKLISHSSVSWAVQGKFFGRKDPTQSYLTTSSVQSGYEYILDNWNRFLLGPRYYFDTQSVGGYLAYLMVWDHFHFEVGVNSMNLSKFKVGKNGMLPFLDLSWRL